MQINIPVGISDFEKIRQNGYYYIDKSGLISEIMKTESTEVTLITRPRRFGKTLAMSMLNSFFDIRKDNQKIFEGLEVSKEKELCTRWMNQRPTIFLTLKNVDGLDFITAYEQLVYEIASLYERFDGIREREEISQSEKEIFERIKARRAGKIEI